MPRIRTLKPEALQHRKVGRLSDGAFRLWIACLTQADDHGRLIFDPDQFRLLIWGYHGSKRARDVVGAATELLACGLVRGYAVDKSVDKIPTLFFDFPSWSDHQKVDHPRKSTLPAWSGAGAELFSRGFERIRDVSRGFVGDRRIDRKEGSIPHAREGKDDARPRDPTRVPDRSSVSRDQDGSGEDDPHDQGKALSEIRKSRGPMSGALAAVLGQLRVAPERVPDPVPREHVEI